MHHGFFKYTKKVKKYPEQECCIFPFSFKTALGHLVYYHYTYSLIYLSLYFNLIISHNQNETCKEKDMQMKVKKICARHSINLVRFIIHLLCNVINAVCSGKSPYIFLPQMSPGLFLCGCLL